MRAARLHGIGDLRVELLPEPEPGPHELLVAIEGCGVCPTDVRKWSLGVNDGEYPFNPGHEWVGRVEQVGTDVDGWKPGQRVYGDTYAGYAELAVLAARPAPWSYGPLMLPDDLPLDRAVFVEPLADCIHAVHDQAQLGTGEHVVVVGGGQMGLQLVAVAARAEAKVVCVEPLRERRALALELGAAEALRPDDWDEAETADVVIVSVGAHELVPRALRAARPGGRVVLFAGFGETSEVLVDLNRIHYREIVLVGSEWIGTPPNQRRNCYKEALDMLTAGAVPLERLVTGYCQLDGLEAAFEAQRALEGLKTILIPGPE